MEKLEHIVHDTVLGFQNSLYQHMPLSAYRNFQTWALSPQNPHLNTWLQMVGVPQFAKLTHTLIGNSVGEDKWDDLVRYSTYMNAYLIYETISDNLAFGLAIRKPDDTTYDLRRKILIDFNRAMIARLQGNRVESDAILGAMPPFVEQLSGFRYSLTHDEQREIAGAFVQQHPAYSLDSIEFGTWNALVANIQSCADVVDLMAQYQLGDYLRQGLIWRYEAVNDLLSQTVMDQEKLVKVSTNTILVIPVLTYYISVLAEILEPEPALGQLLDGGVLTQALEDAALMVRLLNDVGTNLMVSDQFSAPLLNELYSQISGPPAHLPTFVDLLMHYSEKSDLMTRIRKDVVFGEFNVSVYNLTSAPPTPMSLLLFGNNLLYFRDQYQQCQQRLQANLRIIDQTLNSPMVSALISGFVRFHEHIYQYQFDGQAGDYATKPDLQTTPV